MASPPTPPRELGWTMFRGTDAVRTGLLSPRQLRGDTWIRLRQDVYADARLERDHELACRAAALRIPASGAIAGPSAAVMWGVTHAAKWGDPVHILVSHALARGARNGLTVHCAQVDTSDVVERSGLRCTSPLRTAWDVAAWLDVPHAVAIIDSLLAAGLVTRASLDQLVESRRGRRYCRLARTAFGMADPGAQSPPESHLRVRLVLAGLPRPVTQHPVYLSDGTALHPDLAWPEYRVAVEYDGQWHADADQLHRDRRRLNRLVGAGWLVLHVTSQRLRRDFARVIREVRDALRSRGWKKERASG